MAPCGRVKPLDIVRVRRSKRGNDTLQVEKPNKRCPSLAEVLRENKIVTRILPQLCCTWREMAGANPRTNPRPAPLDAGVAGTFMDAGVAGNFPQTSDRT